nr:hypothetical protein [Streptomyces sp. SID8354]
MAGRSSETIVSGGVNIYPAEIENVLREHPHVRDVAATGVPDEEYGQRVQALVQLEPGACLDSRLTAQLDQFCRERLAGFKVPRCYAAVPRIPREASGKLRRSALDSIQPAPSPEEA